MPETSSHILTKIVATIGPDCANLQTLSRMIEEGVRVVRINFSHGDFKQFTQSLKLVRKASKQTNIPVGVLGDLRGPKLRVGKIKNDSLQLNSGQSIKIVANQIEGEYDESKEQVIISTTYPKIVDEVKPGNRILINDGAIRLLVTDKQTEDNDNSLICTVTRADTLSSNKGINLPDTKISAPSLTEYDKKCIDWAVDNSLDFLALSFVRNYGDVKRLQTILSSYTLKENTSIPIIAKIETPQAVNDIDNISQISDGIMVARGDLGVELDIAKVPIMQKRIIKSARKYGKPIIVATQMLQSMIDNPQPTRAEVSDIANAIIDKTDALMLSGETAIGKFPIQTVAAMAHTALVTEGYAISYQLKESKPPAFLEKNKYRTAALAHGVSAASVDLGCKCAVIWSQRGGGARYLSQNRLPIPIVAISSKQAALRKMGLFFGVNPVLMTCPKDYQTFTKQVNDLLKNKRLAYSGDTVIIMSGTPLGTQGTTNQLHMHYIDGVCKVD